MMAIAENHGTRPKSCRTDCVQLSMTSSLSRMASLIAFRCVVIILQLFFFIAENKLVVVQNVQVMSR